MRDSLGRKHRVWAYLSALCLRNGPFWRYKWNMKSRIDLSVWHASKFNEWKRRDSVIVSKRVFFAMWWISVGFPCWLVHAFCIIHKSREKKGNGDINLCSKKNNVQVCSRSFLVCNYDHIRDLRHESRPFCNRHNEHGVVTSWIYHVHRIFEKARGINLWLDKDSFSAETFTHSDNLFRRLAVLYLRNTSTCYYW